VRLELTRRTDLALRGLQSLAASRPVRRKGPHLAAAIGTTPAYIAQVMTPLVHLGWVVSEPGPTGGYLLAADLADISLLDLIEAVEGPTVDGRCVLHGRPCADVALCPVHASWVRARDALLAELAATRLADVGSYAESSR